jgi:hypothetical protein
MKRKAAIAACFCALALRTPAVLAQTPPPERVAITYVAPLNQVHDPLFKMLMDQQVLERVREVLAHIRWPSTLQLEIKGCEGESNAWYEEGTITVCYEYLYDMWRQAHSRNRPAYVTREDAFIGPVVDTFLHEAGHAIFHLLKIPLLGREENAADQFAAYVVLKFAGDKRKKLIIGSAYGYASMLKVRSARDLSRPRLGFGRHITQADEHGTPAQRLYNLLCIAYGSDKEMFADVVKKGYLPAERAEKCEDEYSQVDFAYQALIAPHVDK